MPTGFFLRALCLGRAQRGSKHLTLSVAVFRSSSPFSFGENWLHGSGGSGTFAEGRFVVEPPAALVFDHRGGSDALSRIAFQQKERLRTCAFGGGMSVIFRGHKRVFRA